jgi:alkylation response protein AidB-like acyl-CoA dehydrogenase
VLATIFMPGGIVGLARELRVRFHRQKLSMSVSASESERLQAITSFASKAVATAAADWAVGAEPDLQMRALAAQLGLTKLQVPVDHGGLGLSFAFKVLASEILAAADFGFAMSLVNTHNVAVKLALSAPPDVAARYMPRLLDGRATACAALTEPGVGSDVAAMTTTAAREGDGWLIRGEKTWIVNARHADMAIVYAQCGQKGDHAGIGAFLVDLTVPQCRRYPIESPFSQTSFGTGGFVLDGCRVPAAHLLMAPGTAFKSIMTEINGARTYVAAMCCAMVMRYGIAPQKGRIGGHKATMAGACFGPKNGHGATPAARPLCATSNLRRPYVAALDFITRSTSSANGFSLVGIGSKVPTRAASAAGPC